MPNNDTKCLGGVFYVKADGMQFHTSADTMTVPLNKYTKTSQVSTSGVPGYTKARRVPFVECSGFVTPEFPFEIFDRSDLTITVEFADGKAYVLNNAWVAGDSDLDGSAGTTTLRFEGEDGDFIN